MIAAIAVVALLAWWLIPSGSPDEEPTEVVETETVVIDSVAPDDSDEAADDSVWSSAEPGSAADAKADASVPGEATPTADAAEASSATASSASTSAPAAASSSASTSAPAAASSSAASSAVAVSGDVEQEALNVIKGMYGNGQVRKDKLGAEYQKIQNRVNELKRQGAF